MSIDQKKRIVVIIGMHRSGTSVIARGLKVLGVTLGDNLMPPGEDNPKGYWEDLDINELNVELLNFFKMSLKQIWKCSFPTVRFA